jgi:hypothetical protein
MPSRCLALVALVLLLLGCTRYNSRAQGPFAARPAPAGPGPTTLPAAPAAARGPLALNTPTNLLPPAPPGDAQPVPPRPPEPAGVGPGYAYTPPQTPRPPAVPESPGVVPAGGVPPDTVADADSADRRRIFRRPAAPAAPTNPAVTAPAAAPASPAAPLKKLVQVAAEKWKGLDTYEAKLTRRESVGGAAPSTEEVVFQFRKEPMAVYMRNTGEVGRGREVLFNPSQHGDKVHVVVGEGDTRFLKAGSKAPSLSPDSPQVRSKSRHSIREVGFGNTIEKFARVVAAVDAGKLPADALKYTGPVKRTEYGELPLEAVEQTIRPGQEEGLPAGGVRQWFFDGKPDSPAYGLPVLVITFENGPQKAREVEYYCFTQFRGPAGLSDADFDPARLGKKK